MTDPSCVGGLRSHAQGREGPRRPKEKERPGRRPRREHAKPQHEQPLALAAQGPTNWELEPLRDPEGPTANKGPASLALQRAG